MEPAQLFLCLSASACAMMDCEIDALTDIPIILSSNLSYGLDVLQFPSWVYEDGSSLTPPDKFIHSNTISPIALPSPRQWFPGPPDSLSQTTWFRTFLLHVCQSICNRLLLSQNCTANHLLCRKRTIALGFCGG